MKMSNAFLRGWAWWGNRAGSDMWNSFYRTFSCKTECSETHIQKSTTNFQL